MLFVICKDKKSFIIFVFYFDVGYRTSRHRVVRDAGKQWYRVMCVYLDLVRTWYGASMNSFRILFLCVSLQF